MFKLAVTHRWLRASVQLKLDLDKTCKTPVVKPSEGRISSLGPSVAKCRNTGQPCEENTLFCNINNFWKVPSALAVDSDGPDVNSP